MANKSQWKGGRLGPFHLARRYKDKDVGTGLGRLYEAHNVRTGAPALVLLPGPRAGWDPSEAWQIHVSSQVEPTPHVVLEVKQVPASGKLPELSAMLDVLTSVVENVEENDEVRTHLTREPLKMWRRWIGRARRLLLSRWSLAAAGFVTAGGVALWLLFRSPSDENWMDRSRGNATTTSASDLSLLDGGDSDMSAIAYPLPKRPFANQATPPCKSRRGEVELSGGCWVAIEKRPPCEDTAEHQGKCYLPVGERAPRVPQSVQE